METIMSALQIRTGMPFGYLFLGVGWLVWMTVLAVILLRRIKRQKIASFGSFVSLAGLTLGAMFLISNIAFSERLDFNPFFPEEALLGSWEQGASTIKFEDDNSAMFNLDPELRKRMGVANGNGYWRKTGDFNISIGNQGISQTAMLRVIRYGDNLRIIIEDFGDLDFWDGELGFRKSTN